MGSPYDFGRQGVLVIDHWDVDGPKNIPGGSVIQPHHTMDTLF